MNSEVMTEKKRGKTLKSLVQAKKKSNKDKIESTTTKKNNRNVIYNFTGLGKTLDLTRID